MTNFYNKMLVIELVLFLIVFLSCDNCRTKKVLFFFEIRVKIIQFHHQFSVSVKFDNQVRYWVAFISGCKVAHVCCYEFFFF